MADGQQDTCKIYV